MLYLCAFFLTALLSIQDQWPLGRIIEVNQHKTVEDRLAVANRFVKQYALLLSDDGFLYGLFNTAPLRNAYQIHMVVDDIKNPFMTTYWAHPERFYIIQDGKVRLFLFYDDPSHAHTALLRWL